MTYADITHRDPNPIKRFLQRSRLIHAVRMAWGRPAPRTILDFGAGDGELCKHLRSAFPRSRILCYEPAPQLLAQARENLRASEGIKLLSHLKEIAPGSIDLVFSLEVFEHLPPVETAAALDSIAGLLPEDGHVIIGVPVEVGIPALYKGVFRIMRRHGEFDATLKNVLACTVGRPPLARPVSAIAGGMNYHSHHVGFDHRRFRSVLSERFDVEAAVAAPLPQLGPALNPEIYFLAGRPRCQAT